VAPSARTATGERRTTEQANEAWDRAQPQLAERPHVVIVGGGFGGMAAARALAAEQVRVTLVDRKNHHLFQPLLYQVAMAGLSPADIAMPIRTLFRGQDNVRVLLADVAEVQLAERQLALRDGERLSFDYLILAAGARTNYFGHEGSWGPHALALKELDHAVEIRRRVLLAFEAAERELDPLVRARLQSFVVIGGGPTGVEMAGALAELGRRVLVRDFRVARPEQTRVVLLEMTDRLLPGFAPELAQAAAQQLQELGVTVRTKASVQDIDERGVLVAGERIEAATVLWTAGVRPPELAEALSTPLSPEGRVKVERDCSLPGHAQVFAIGDMAHFPGDGEKPLPGLAPVAMQQGEYVARVIGRRLRGEPAPAPFAYQDRGMMATVGRSRAVLQTSRMKLAGFTAWMLWLVIHIWYLMGFRNRVAVLASWCWSYLTYRQGARLITGGAAPEHLREVTAAAERASGAHPRAALEASRAQS
jgi:NADH dehydrogenase